jgi:hypothetical protein
MERTRLIDSVDGSRRVRSQGTRSSRSQGSESTSGQDLSPAEPRSALPPLPSSDFIAHEWVGSIALTATGLIWVRYSFVIVPVNLSLAGVNCFVAATGMTSLYRAWE